MEAARGLDEQPLVMGRVGYVAMLHLAVHLLVSEVAAMVFIFGLRAAAMHWSLGVPHWLHVPHR